jgi:cytochrome c oxidase subunit IV
MTTTHGTNPLDELPGPDGVRIDESHNSEHMSDLGYMKVALILAFITALEVTISYVDIGPIFLPLLLILMTIKFFSVVMYFMHLKFDNRIFTVLFYMGLFLAVGVYCVALATFHFFRG